MAKIKELLSFYILLCQLKKRLLKYREPSEFDKKIIDLILEVDGLEVQVLDKLKSLLDISDFDRFLEIIVLCGVDFDNIQEFEGKIRIPLKSRGRKQEIILTSNSKLIEEGEFIETQESFYCENKGFDKSGVEISVYRHYFVDGKYRGEFVLDLIQSTRTGRTVWHQLIVVQNRRWQRFDKMYIIDSLKSDDDTAFHLEQQIEKYKHLGSGFCVRKKVQTDAQWKYEISKIISESGKRQVPIVHLEIHGDNNGNLIVGNTIEKMSDFIDSMKELSAKCGTKILLSLAVCNGIKYFYEHKKQFEEFPFSCVIGANTIIQSSNLEAQFSAFYKELFQDSNAPIDISRAFNKMEEVYNSNKSNKDLYPGETFIMLSNKSKTLS